MRYQAESAAGDPIVWLREPRGGYGFTERVLARVVGIRGKRVRVAALLKDERTWREVSVKEENLRLPSDAERERIERAMGATNAHVA
jgi:hypothetical protein